MINNFALLLSHSLLLLVCWRVIGRADLDDDNADAAPGGFAAHPASSGPAATD